MLGRHVARACTAALALAAAACSPPPGIPHRSARAVATFTGVLDPVAGTLRVIPDARAMPVSTTLALTAVPVDGGGVPGSGPPDTVELVTEALQRTTTGCGGTPSFEGTVRMRSFYAGARLENVHVQFVEMSSSGREACNSDPEVPGTSAAFALFDYGDLAPAGRGGDHSARVWKLRLPDSTPYTFRGVVVADVVTDWAPQVSSTFPAAGAEDVPTGAVIEVTFDEPINPATLAIQVTGGVTGTTTWDAATRTARFVPDAALQPAAVYTVTVPTSVADPTGHGLAVAHTFSFATATPWQRISGTTRATVEHRKLLFAQNGDGLALWTSFTGTGRRLYYRSWSPGDAAWGPAVLVATATGSTPVLEATAAAGTNGFMLVWSQGGLKSAQVEDGRLGATTVINTVGVTYVEAASVGREFAVVYLGAEAATTGYHARTFDGTAWSAATKLVTASASRPAIASNGVTYLTAVPTYGGLYLHTWEPGTGWRALTSPYTLGETRSPAIASNGTSYCVAYTRSGTYRVEAVIVSNGAVGAAANLGGGIHPPLSVASNGTGYAVAYASSGIWAAVHDGSAWSATSQLTAYTYTSAVSAAANGSRYLAAWLEHDFVGMPWKIAVKSFEGGAWSASETVLADAAASPEGVAAASFQDGWLIASPHDDGARHQLRALPFGAAGVGTPYWLAADDTSSAREVALATNASGDGIAAWTQPHRGRNAVFAAIRSGGTWGSPELVATDAEKAVVSASATAFLVAYVDYSTGPARAAARVRSGGTWGAAYRFWLYSTLNMNAATDGSSFAVAFLDLNGAAWSPMTALWSGGSWTVQNVATGSSIDTPIRVAGVPGEFRYVWKYYTGATGTPAYRYQVKTRRAVVAANAWTFEPEVVLDDNGKNGRYEPNIAAGPDGFMLVWEQVFFPQHVRGTLCTGAICAPFARVDAGTNCMMPGVTSGLGGFVAVYPCSGSVRANLWASGAWGVDGATGSTSWVYPAALAGSDKAVRMALLFPGAGTPPADSIQVREWSGAGAWTAPFEVETVTLDITDPIGNAWAAGEWIVTFQQTRPVDPAVDAIYARTDL